jgi:hypothetical protein
MMWLTWRQFRAQARVALAALAVVAVLLVVTGLHIAHGYNASGIPACRGAGDCEHLAANYLTGLRASTGLSFLYQAVSVVLYAVPALIGAFWGAPVITRELEAGTLRLAWSQSVTRTRWLTVKLGAVGLAAMATAGLLSLMVTWWAAPVTRATALAGSGSALRASFSPFLFGARDITPVGYAAFAFVLGVTAGLLLRRTVAAIATSLAVFAGAEAVMALVIRAHLLPAARAISPLNAGHLTTLSISTGGQGSTMTVGAPVTHEPGAWILSNQTIAASGRAFTGPPPAACVGNDSTPAQCTRAVGALHLRQLVTYQPASHYWPLQWTETGIFLALALALAGLCYWWVRRRVLA